MCGMEECQERIYKLIQDCKEKANIPEKEPLAALVSGSGNVHRNNF